jgi:hypothetical protein
LTPELNDSLYRDFRDFATTQLASGDIDPAYPVLRSVAAQAGLSEDAALWLSFLHVAYYNIASAVIAFSHHPEPYPSLGETLLHLPTGVERRGHRDYLRLHRHILCYWMALAAQAEGSGLRYWTEGITANLSANFLTVYHRASRLYGNGRWAAFKWAEVLKSVHDIAMTFPDDMCLTDERGPRYGLRVLYGLRDYPDGIAFAADDLLRRMREDGYPGLQPEQLETLLCDFGSMVNGHYYPGHDIDQQIEQINRADWSLAQGGEVWRNRLSYARYKSFPEDFLGHEVDKPRLKEYRAKGGWYGR